MNSVEQHKHKTAIEALRAEMEENFKAVKDILDAFADSLSDQSAALASEAQVRASLGEEMGRRIEDYTRYVVAHYVPSNLTLWARLRWLVTGRV